LVVGADNNKSDIAFAVYQQRHLSANLPRDSRQSIGKLVTDYFRWWAATVVEFLQRLYLRRAKPRGVAVKFTNGVSPYRYCQ